MPSNTWNEFITQFPEPHLLQTSNWGKLKSKFGWRAHFLVWKEQGSKFSVREFQEYATPPENPAAACLVLERKLPLGLGVMYVPKGPLLRDWGRAELRTAVLSDLEDFARQRSVILIKLDPDVLLGTGIPGKESAQEFPGGREVIDHLQSRGWLFSQDQIQYRNSVIVDLSLEEDDLLAAMKSKTRYNIRLAGRKGVTVREGGREDFELLYDMYAETSDRGGFTIRGEDYYRTAWELFIAAENSRSSQPSCQPLIAEVEGKKVAGSVIFKFAGRAWYLHGMSTLDHSEKMPTYRIQWESMRWAKDQGCRSYDMWGAPDEFSRDDPLWGVYRFKNGFGGTVTRTIGAWDYPVRPWLYRFYLQVLPRMLDIMRFVRDLLTRSRAGKNS